MQMSVIGMLSNSYMLLFCFSHLLMMPSIEFQTLHMCYPLLEEISILLITPVTLDGKSRPALHTS